MRKTIVVLLLLAFLLPCAVATATALPTETVNTAPAAFSGFLTFAIKFNNAVIITGSDHVIQIGRVGGQDKGDVTQLSTSLSDQIVLYLTVENDSKRITQALLGYIGDGTEESASDFLTAVGELLYAVEAIDDMEQTAAFVLALDLPDHLENGDRNALVIDGLEYAYEMSSISGILFTVTVVE